MTRDALDQKVEAKLRCQERGREKVAGTAEHRFWDQAACFGTVARPSLLPAHSTRDWNAPHLFFHHTLRTSCCCDDYIRSTYFPGSPVKSK